MVEIPSRTSVIHELKKSNSLIAGVLPSHYPRELLRAFHIHPVEIWGPPEVKDRSGEWHFQSYTCAIVRNATSFLLSEGLEQIDLLLIPHTCDAMQGMATIWNDFIRPHQKVLTLYLPRGKRRSDEDFLRGELLRLSGELESFTGRNLDASSLLVAIEREKELDRRIAAFYQNRDFLALSDREFYTLVRSREFLPPEQVFSLLDSVAYSEENSPSGTRICLSGILPEPMNLFDCLNRMGARVVADDFACCGRRFYPEIDESDPFRWMARRLLGVPPCPTRGHPISERISHLKEKIRKAGAQALMIYDPMFCEPELFDIPAIQQQLTATGIPTLHLEVAELDSLPLPTSNRMEAFLEMIS